MLVSRIPIGATSRAAAMNASLTEIANDSGSSLSATSSYSMSPLDSLSTVTLLPPARASRRSNSTGAVPIVVTEAKPASRYNSSCSNRDDRRTTRRSVTLPMIDLNDQRLGSPLAKILSKSTINLDNRLSWLRRAQTARQDRHGSLDETSDGDTATVSGWWSLEAGHADEAFEESTSIPEKPEPNVSNTSLHSTEQSPMACGAPSTSRTELASGKIATSRRSRLPSDPGLSHVVTHFETSPKETRELGDLPAGGSPPTASSLAHPLARAMSRASCDLSTRTRERPSSSTSNVTLPDVHRRERPRSSSIGSHQMRPNPSFAHLADQQRRVYTPPPQRSTTDRVLPLQGRRPSRLSSDESDSVASSGSLIRPDSSSRSGKQQPGTTSGLHHANGASTCRSSLKSRHMTETKSMYR